MQLSFQLADLGCLLQGGMEWQRRWMNAFGRLVYVVERGKKTVIALRAQEAQEKRRQLAQQTSLTGSAQVPSPSMVLAHAERWLALEGW